MPPVNVSTILSLRASMAARSSFTPSTVMPCSANLCMHALVVLRGLEQRLGRNAAHVQAGAAQAGLALAVLPVVDADGLEAELRGADGGGVAARAGADDCDVELLCHVLRPQ